MKNLFKHTQKYSIIYDFSKEFKSCIKIIICEDSKDIYVKYHNVAREENMEKYYNFILEYLDKIEITKLLSNEYEIKYEHKFINLNCVIGRALIVNIPTCEQLADNNYKITEDLRDINYNDALLNLHRELYTSQHLHKYKYFKYLSYDIYNMHGSGYFLNNKKHINNDMFNNFMINNDKNIARNLLEDNFKTQYPNNYKININEYLNNKNIILKDRTINYHLANLITEYFDYKLKYNYSKDIINTYNNLYSLNIKEIKNEHSLLNEFYNEEINHIKILIKEQTTLDDDINELLVKFNNSDISQYNNFNVNLKIDELKNKIAKVYPPGLQIIYDHEINFIITNLDFINKIIINESNKIETIKQINKYISLDQALIINNQITELFLNSLSIILNMFKTNDLSISMVEKIIKFVNDENLLIIKVGLISNYFNDLSTNCESTTQQVINYTIDCLSEESSPHYINNQILNDKILINEPYNSDSNTESYDSNSNTESSAVELIIVERCVNMTTIIESSAIEFQIVKPLILNSDDNIKIDVVNSDHNETINSDIIENVEINNKISIINDTIFTYSIDADIHVWDVNLKYITELVSNEEITISYVNPILLSNIEVSFPLNLNFKKIIFKNFTNLVINLDNSCLNKVDDLYLINTTLADKNLHKFMLKNNITPHYYVSK